MHDPWHKPEKISAGSLNEKRLISGPNFPDSLGPPAALQLTAPRAPLSFMSPLRGNWCLVPAKEISRKPHPNGPVPPGVPHWFRETENDLGFEYAPGIGETVVSFQAPNIGFTQGAVLPGKGGVP